MMPEELTAAGRAGRVKATLRVAAAARSTSGDDVRPFTVDVTVAKPWHIYAHGATIGLPLEVDAEAPIRVVDVEFPPRQGQEIEGRFTITGTLSGAVPGGTLLLRTQACDSSRCEPPAIARLTLAVPDRAPSPTPEPGLGDPLATESDPSGRPDQPALPELARRGMS